MIGALPVVRAPAVPSRPSMVLLSTGLAMFAVFLDTTILFVAFRSIGADFPTADPAALSWILNAYTIAFAATLIPAGRLADRIGRRRTFLGAVVLFTLASVLCGTAPSVGWLVAARVLQAVGAAALVPSSLALVLQSVPRHQVAQSVAIWSAVGAVAGAVGPTLGALVIAHASWRWAFYINVPVGIVSLWLGRRVLPEGGETSVGPLPDPVGVAVLIAAFASMSLAIVEADTWASGSVLALFAASLALLAGFVWRCGRVANPLVDLGLFALPSFRLGNAATLLFSIGFSATFLANVLFLTGVWGYSIVRTGLAVSIGPLVVALTAPLFGKLAGRIGQRSLLVPGGLIWASGGLYFLAQVTTTPHYLAHYLPATVLVALGVSLVHPQLSSVSVQGLPPNGFGTGSAINQAIRNLGGTLGVALLIAFTAHVEPALVGFHRVWWLLVASGVGVTTMSAFLPRPSAGTVR